MDGWNRRWVCDALREKMHGANGDTNFVAIRAALRKFFMYGRRSC